MEAHLHKRSANWRENAQPGVECPYSTSNNMKEHLVETTHVMSRSTMRAETDDPLLSATNGSM